MSDIEWRDVNEGDLFGWCGGELIAIIDMVGQEIRLRFFIGHPYTLRVERPDQEAAKLKAESLLAEWDKKRGMMKVPVLCDRCGDSGVDEELVCVNEKCRSHDKGCFEWCKKGGIRPDSNRCKDAIGDMIPCPCTTNPTAWVNVKQTIGGNLNHDLPNLQKIP